MKINDKVLPISGSVKGDAAAAASAGEVQRSGADAAGRKGDTVELSRNAEQFARVSEALQKLPDIRVEKVEQLKKQIAAGEYRVKASDVAEKMLMSMKKGVAA